MLFEENIIIGSATAASLGLPASGGRRIKVVIDIADASAPPPTTTIGDRYILDTASTSVDAGWGTVSAGDIVEYTGNEWKAITPEEGMSIFVDAKDTDFVFVDDGTPDWIPLNIYDGGTY